MIKKALTIAGFDGSGGAGLQADLKTFSALGCYGMTVLTALPVQNTMGVSSCYPIPLKVIEEQLESIFNDITPDVIKIGMLFSEEIILLVERFLTQNAVGIPIVIDPVMVAKSGHRLLQPEAIDALKNKLFKLAAIVTPNLDEAALICGSASIQTKEEMLSAGQVFLDLGAQAVLIKGGHLKDELCSDLLLTAEYSRWLEAKRIKTKNTHGTGCTLSAAIAANLAMNMGLIDSCSAAKKYITGALQSFQNEKIGKGNGPVNHFYNIWCTQSNSNSMEVI
jgi:hydroxymethylpyrimidine/phosphomethylpyrimidine kinase